MTDSLSTPDAVADSPAPAGPRRTRVVASATAVGDRVRWLLDTVSVGLDVAKVRVLPPSILAGQVQPDEDDPDDWRFLRRPAVLGFVALVAVAVGASLRELAVQARDARHLVLRRADQSRSPPTSRSCCSAWWPCTAASSCSCGSGTG